MPSNKFLLLAWVSGGKNTIFVSMRIHVYIYVYTHKYESCVVWVYVCMWVCLCVQVSTSVCGPVEARERHQCPLPFFTLLSEDELSRWTQSSLFLRYVGGQMPWSTQQVLGLQVCETVLGDSCPPSHPSALEYFKLVSHPMKTKIEARSFCTSIQALGWSSQVFKSEVKHEAGRSGGSSLRALLLPWGSPNPTLWAHREHFVSCVHCGRHFAVFLECVLHEVSVRSKWNTRIPAALKRMDFSKFLGHIGWVLTAAMVAAHGARKYPELRGRRLCQVLKWRHQWSCWAVWVGKQ